MKLFLIRTYLIILNFLVRRAESLYDFFTKFFWNIFSRLNDHRNRIFFFEARLDFRALHGYDPIRKPKRKNILSRILTKLLGREVIFRLRKYSNAKAINFKSLGKSTGKTFNGYHAGRSSIYIEHKIPAKKMNVGVTDILGKVTVA